MGPVEVPADRLWGAQTERSRNFFAIGAPRFVWARRVIRALGLLKKPAAVANASLGTVSQERADLMAARGKQRSRDDRVFERGSEQDVNGGYNVLFNPRAPDRMFTSP